MLESDLSLRIWAYWVKIWWFPAVWVADVSMSGGGCIACMKPLQVMQRHGWAILLCSKTRMMCGKETSHQQTQNSSTNLDSSSCRWCLLIGSVFANKGSTPLNAARIVHPSTTLVPREVLRLGNFAHFNKNKARNSGTLQISANQIHFKRLYREFLASSLSLLRSSFGHSWESGTWTKASHTAASQLVFTARLRS